MEPNGSVPFSFILFLNFFRFYSLSPSQQPTTSSHPQAGNPATVSAYLSCEYANKHGLPFRVESALPLTRSLESGDQAI
jgi:hypothetical protein